jgi:hypothetical protein
MLISQWVILDLLMLQNITLTKFTQDLLTVLLVRVCAAFWRQELSISTLISWFRPSDPFRLHCFET